MKKKDNFNIRFILRINEDIKKDLEFNAKFYGISQAQYIRHLIKKDKI
jgi:predicted HicB family RNase H-like nuclease